MKKQLIFLAFIGLGFSLQAQSFSVGLKAGGNYSTYTKIDDAKGAILYHAGAYAGYAINDKLALQVEALYSIQGQDGEDDTFKERTTYLNAPLMLKYQIAPRLQAMAGGQIGLLMKAKLKIDDTDGGTETLDRKYKYESTDLAAVGGIEYELSDRLTFGLRTNIGLGSFHKQLTDSRQNVYQASVAYRLFSL